MVFHFIVINEMAKRCMSAYQMMLFVLRCNKKGKASAFP
ncbi:hypothetical protein UYSO10_3279 [Kosakonia radicincitans]|nr:hypothetical protein UYSO10_3279 [Kosakonia radicincitans]